MATAGYSSLEEQWLYKELERTSAEITHQENQLRPLKTKAEMLTRVLQDKYGWKGLERT